MAQVATASSALALAPHIEGHAGWVEIDAALTAASARGAGQRHGRRLVLAL